MSIPIWLTIERMERLQPFVPKSHAKLRVDDRRVLGGMTLSIATGCDALREDGPPKTRHNRWKWRGHMGVFARMMEGLAFEG